MALTRREFIGSVSGCIGAIWGCAVTKGLVRGDIKTREIASTSPTAPDAKNIVVFMPDTAQTKDVWTGLSDELASEYHLIAIRIDSATDASVIADALERYHPMGLVLMNNPTVAAYRQYQQQGGRRPFPPAVVVMTSFLEHRSADLEQTTGIAYEVPLITAMTNLRRLLVLPTERVGVVVRTHLRRFVQRQVALASRERIVVNVEVVSQNPNPSEVKRAIRRLKQRADVIWILNDNRLLSPTLLAEAWLPGLDERPWIPTIVGAASLVSAQKSFGTFAVLPDHLALGSQAGSMMLDIASNGWRVTEDNGVQLPLSTTTTIDLVQVKERFVLQPDALKQVDRILE